LTGFSSKRITGSGYAVKPDGKRFLVNARVETTDRLPMTVVLNWPAAAKR